MMNGGRIADSTACCSRMRARCSRCWCSTMWASKNCWRSSFSLMTAPKAAKKSERRRKPTSAVKVTDSNTKAPIGTMTTTKLSISTAALGSAATPNVSSGVSAACMYVRSLPATVSASSDVPVPDARPQPTMSVRATACTPKASTTEGTAWKCDTKGRAHAQTVATARSVHDAGVGTAALPCTKNEATTAIASAASPTRVVVRMALCLTSTKAVYSSSTSSSSKRMRTQLCRRFEYRRSISSSDAASPSAMCCCFSMRSARKRSRCRLASFVTRTRVVRPFGDAIERDID
mmetsp:Transcript_6381/g.20078  ORF Transcript_6381/g.20078 Transcript_6381/m.20078 type:complete len:290 (-) Transcript_6381:1458-2327(-)